MERIRFVFLMLLLVLPLIAPVQVSAQSLLPANMTIEGRFFLNGSPVNEPVDVEFSIYSASKPTCILYRETHTNFDVSATAVEDRGVFAISLGSGGTVDYAPGGGLASVFVNGSLLNGEGACSVTPGNSEQRMLITKVKKTSGGAYVQLDPTAISSAPTAMIAQTAQTLQGKVATDFVQVRDDGATVSLSQANLENIFSFTNYPKLDALVNGTSNQYMVANPSGSVGFNNQRITNVAAPSATGDAATKGYSDAYMAGKQIDLQDVAAGTGGGKVLMWDSAQNKWVAQAPAGDSTKLPLAGGTMSGAINMNGNNITNAGNLPTLTAGKISASVIPDAIGAGAGSFGSATQVPTFTVGADGRITAASNVTISGVVPGGSAGGDLSGTYPNPSIKTDAVTSGKILDGEVKTADLADAGVTPVKLVNGVNVVNRMFLTDGITGSTFVEKTCANNEVLKYTTGTGWSCASIVSLSAVTQVEGRTGNIDIDLSDIQSAGTAAAQNIGTAVGDVIAVQAGGKLPALDASNLTNVSAVKLHSRDIDTAMPNASDVLMWDNVASKWKPSPLPAPGESNTASNQGAGGVGVFLSKSGADLQFKNINVGSNKVTVTNDAANKEVDIDVDQTKIDHDQLLNYSANKHVDHTAVSVATAAGTSGLSGGGDLTATRNLIVDITGTAALGAAADNADEIMIYDTSATALKKVTRSQFNLSEAEVDAMVGNNGYAADSGVLKKDGSVALTADWDVGAKRLRNLADPSSSSDAVTRSYSDGKLGGNTLDLSGLTGGQVLQWDNTASKWKPYTIPAAGEVNSGSNVGTAGVGVFKQKSGLNLEFKKINAAGSKITITDDTINNEVDIDVSESSLTLSNLGGTLSVAKGGTGQTSYTDGQLLIGNSSGNTLTKATLTSGAGVNITNGSGSITIASSLGTSVDLTTEVTGTLPVANGGTGQTSITGDWLSQYALLNGRSAGQTLTGGTGPSGSLTLESTSHATKGNVYINPNGGNVGIGTASPGAKLDVRGNIAIPNGGSFLQLPDVNTNAVSGISAGAAYMDDGVPFYGGFARESGAMDGSVINGSTYPDYVVTNLTGLRLAAHSGYGGVSIYDMWNGTLWSSAGSEIARFRTDTYGSSYISSKLGIGTSTVSAPLHVVGQTALTTLFSENFESGTASSMTMANTAWVVQSSVVASGSWAAKSGTIGDLGMSTMSRNITYTSAGSISFAFRVDSESCSTCDYLEFFINGVQVGKWGGLVNWTTVTYPIDTPATYTFTWRYSKDFSQSVGADAAWVDNIVAQMDPNPPAAIIFGKVGIGTSTPMDRLHVAGDIRVGTAGSNGCIRNANGGVLGGTCSSDVRFKKDFRRMTPIAERMAHLQPTYYRFRSEEFPDKHWGDQEELGLIAQEVEKVFPDLVERDDDGYLRVKYSNLTMLLVEAFREGHQRAEEQAREIAGLKQENAGLKSAVDQIKAENKELKAAICELNPKARICN